MYNQIKFDPNNDNYLTAYHMMLSAMTNPENGHSLSRKEFIENCFMLVYQLTPTGEGGFSRELNGQLKLQLTFSRPLAAAVRLLAIGKTQGNYLNDLRDLG